VNESHTHTIAADGGIFCFEEFLRHTKVSMLVVKSQGMDRFAPPAGNGDEERRRLAMFGFLTHAFGAAY